MADTNLNSCAPGSVQFLSRAVDSVREAATILLKWEPNNIPLVAFCKRILAQGDDGVETKAIVKLVEHSASAMLAEGRPWVNLTASSRFALHDFLRKGASNDSVEPETNNSQAQGTVPMSTDENIFRDEYRSQKVTMEQLGVTEEQYIESRQADEAEGHEPGESGDVPAEAFDSAETLGAAVQAALEADGHPEVLERLGVTREAYIKSASDNVTSDAE